MALTFISHHSPLALFSYCFRHGGALPFPGQWHYKALPTPTHSHFTLSSPPTTIHSLSSLSLSPLPLFLFAFTIWGVSMLSPSIPPVFPHHLLTTRLFFFSVYTCQLKGKRTFLFLGFWFFSGALAHLLPIEFWQAGAPAPIPWADRHPPYAMPYCTYYAKTFCFLLPPNTTTIIFGIFLFVWWQATLQLFFSLREGQVGKMENSPTEEQLSAEE